MDGTVGGATFPVDLEGSLDPGQLPEITLRNDTHMTTMANHDHGSPSQTASWSYSGRISPVRGRTIKEYDKQISDLKKENFNLKIRIFHMEERMQQRYGDGQDVYKTNVELQVQIEKLKKDLADKQDLIQKAGVAMDTLAANCKQDEESMRNRIQSEFVDEINRIQSLLEDSNKECDKYRKESEEALHRMEALQQDLNTINADLCKSNREKDDLADKLKNAEFDVQHLTAQLKLTEQSKSETEKENLAISQRLKDLNDQLRDSQKEVTRNKRDLQNLSALLEDHSHVDSTSILEPVHKQDEIEDALDTIQRKDDKLKMLEDSLKQKVNMVGNLEDALRDIEKKLLDSDSEKKKADIETDQLSRHNEKLKKTLDTTLKTLVHKDAELKGSKDKLNTAMEDIKILQEDLKKVKQENTKTLGDLTKEITELEVDNRRLKLQLTDAEGTAENLAMSLGKKEGEVAGFQDQLKRAMDALQSSDDAVETLHNQLKSERAEFDRKLREQALKHETLNNQLKADRAEFDRKLRQQASEHETNPDRQMGASPAKEQLSDSEKMEALRHSTDVASLAARLKALEVELHGKDLKIQALENPRAWIESHNTVHHFTERKDAGVDLMTDIKKLLDQLHKEMASLSSLHHLLAQLNKSGDTASSAELLLTEISSVQRIYRQLEGGVEKNSQIHQALLNSLRGDRRQSDSPDSNSCQDGGYNLGPSGHVVEGSDKQLQGLTSSSPGKTVAAETSLGQVDRSLQTGTALSHSDQWVQTAHSLPEPVHLARSSKEDSYGKGNTELKSPLFAGQAQQTKFHSNGSLKSPGKFPNLIPSHRVRNSQVHFAENAEDCRHTSLTDDAKGIHPHSLDYFNCSPGVLFDEHNFDLRAHDRASSARIDARATGSLPDRNSESAAIPSSTASSAPTSSASNSVHSANTHTPEANESYHSGISDSSKSRREQATSSNGPAVVTNGHHADWANTLDHNDGNVIIGDVIDFNNHRSSSHLSPGSRAKKVNGQSSVSPERKSLVNDQELEWRSKQAGSESDRQSGERGDQRSRRNSWADELEQYRVHDQDRGSDHQAQSKPQQEQQQQIIATMSAVELRDLVAQLQVDLVDAVKEKKALQEELKAVPKRLSGNGHVDTSSKSVAKSKIPRLNASSSCHSTTSEDSDQVDAARNRNSRPNQISLNGQATRAVRSRTASADRENSGESHALIKNLQNKLHATENTVRLLSKKNKAYVSALESAGISASLLNRSNSESCLSSIADASGERAALLANLNTTDQNRRLAYLLSPLKNKEMSCKETNRGISASLPSFDAKLLHSSQISDVVRSPACTTTSCSPVKNSDTSALSNACGLNEVSNSNSASQTMSGTDISEPGVYFKVPAVPSMTSPPNKSGLKNASSDRSQQMSEDQSSHNRVSFDGFGNKSGMSFSQSKNESSNHNKLSASLIDVSAYPDVTYTSLLEGTFLNRFHQMANLDQSLSATVTEDMSSLNMDQLQGRLEHLERVNLTLREEINVYEAIYRSQGTQVSFPSSADNGQEPPKSDDDILKQHLVEIRKLRQRLERLDITKDPEQLLIFQSHTQQRITRQEAMLAHLQQQLVEKEEQHLQECAQLQHRLARDKVAVGERLEQIIADLRKQLETQAVNIQEYEQQILNLKQQVQDGEEREKKQDEEHKRVLSEKSELGDDLVKRDKEFLEMEKMMFRLEMAKESADSDCKRMEGELEEKEKECVNLTKELDDCKENSKCLKEIVVKREKSLQEKAYNLQKLSNEKSAFEKHAREKECQVRRLETDLTNVRKEMQEVQLTHDNMKGQLQSEIQDLKCNLRKKDDLEAKYTFQKAGYEAEVTRLTEEKVQLKATYERELDHERLEVRRQVEDLRNQLRDKQELESELDKLREKVKTIPDLQSEIEGLQSELEYKESKENELHGSLSHIQIEAKSLQESLGRSEEHLKSLQEEKSKIQQDLEEREEKLKKRDKQLKNLITQHMKLETSFSKQKTMLKEKTELIYSQKKQLRLFEVSLTASSQEEKDDIMKQLLKELIATQRQVEELLSRLEQNPISQPTVRVETFGTGNTLHSAGLTTTVTTTSGTGSSASSGQDNVDTALSVGVREESPEMCLGSLSPCASEGELEAQASSSVGCPTVTSPSTNSSPLRPVSTNLSPEPPSLYPLSPSHLRYYTDVDSDITTGMKPQSMVDSDIRSLFAVLKLECHEKLRKESSESLVVLSNMEARLDDRLRAYKSMSVSESIDYSTLRETSMSCRNLHICLEEAVKLAASAWITELPPVDSRGHFYDPVLAEQNENLKRDLTVLRSRHDILDHTVKEQQGRLQASKERHKNWEQSLYKQLHKTAQDMEKAKENFDAAGMVPRKNLSLRVRSPNKSPHKRFDDTV